MFDRIPQSIRDPLWQAKLSLVRWLVNHGFADALHVRLQQQMRDIRPTLVLDVGANRGQYARLMRRLGYRGRIISFEPIPSAVAELTAAARRDGNWQIVPVALGAENGTLPLNVMREEVFSSFLLPSSFGQEAFATSTEVASVVNVPLRRLDAMLLELGVNLEQERTHLKTDTQGYDIQVVRGAGACLPLIESLQCELSLVPVYDGQPAWLDNLREIAELGFDLTGLFAVSRDRQLRLVEADALFRRPESQASA